jgi:SAM-dependent methyltransferase
MLFDDLSGVYEAMIDWPRRLAHEGPFFRRWFDRIGARSVVDVACGTGRHAAMFHGWGLRVEAADLSPAMIERARAALGEPPGLRWVVRGFEEPIERSEPFDAAVCTGNSLALAADRAAARRAMGRMLDALRPGGLAILHVLNLRRLPDGPVVWQKCVRARLAPGEVLIHKGVHRRGTSGYVDLIVTRLDGPAEMQAESLPFLGLEAGWLGSAVRRAGAAKVYVFGGYDEKPYDAAQSVDLILVGERGAVS